MVLRPTRSTAVILKQVRRWSRLRLTEVSVRLRQALGEIQVVALEPLR